MIIQKDNFKSSLNKLFILGISSSFGSLLFIGFLFLSTFGANLSFYNVPFAICGGTLAYFWIMSLKGGYTTIHLEKSTLNDEEKLMFNLIAKYYSKKLVLFFTALIILTYLILDAGKFRPVLRTFDEPLGTGILMFFSVSTLGIGIKYLTAWWRIRKNFDKEIENYEK